MKELRTKQIVALSVVLGLVMFTESLARTNRKQGGSVPASAPRSTPSNSESRQPCISISPRSITSLPQTTMRPQGINRQGINRESSSIFNRSRELNQPSSSFNLSSRSNFSRRQETEEKIYGIPFRELRKKTHIPGADQRPDQRREGVSPPKKLGEREDRERYDDKWRYRDHYYRRYYGYPSHRIFYWIGWPDCYRPIYYPHGPYWSFGYYWPYYHRRFIFISLGGYWPCYPYVRYYWYPCHLYGWYGYYPPEYVITGDTYNYYYYGDSSQPVQVPEKPKEPCEKPAGVITQADRDFEEGVKAFEAKDYATAVTKFQDALKQAPDDIVLPFAYVQALFANGQYQKATEVLRESLSKASPEKEGVFYPRGLYADENVLKEQIAQLSRAVSLNPSDLDLQLLLGYQLLGMSRFDEAVEHLSKAQEDSQNKEAARLLLDLLEKLKKAGG